MFKNVLIAEDHESTSISVRKTLEDLGIKGLDYVYYCDDALTRLQKNLQDRQPFELLITDLYFEADHYDQKLSGGGALIIAARQMQPNIKVLIFSAEHRFPIIDKLFNDLAINGYVRKARNDAQELKAAIKNIYKDNQHFPAQLKQPVIKKNAYNFTSFDITIITLLSQGMQQKDIPAYLEQNNILPSSLSSLEKRISRIKDALGFSKNEQLVSFCKDMRII